MHRYVLFVVLAIPAAAENVRTVCAAGCNYDLNSLQKAVDDAAAGDIIEIAAGQTATVSGGLILRNKGVTAGPHITIRSSAVSQLQPGYRVTPSDAGALATITAVSADYVVSNEKGAGFYRFHGIEIVPPATFMGDVVEFGTRTSAGYVADHEISDLAHDIIFDQCYIHGNPASVDGPRRGIRANLASLTVINSWLENFKNQNGESNAIGGWNGVGPFYFRNNHFEAAAITTLFGGAGPNIKGLRANGLFFLGNHYYRPWKYRVTSGTTDPSGACLYDSNGGEYYTNTAGPTYWRCSGGTWTAIPADQMMPYYWQKNIFELKNAWRTWVEGNYFENAWEPAAQNQLGSMFLFNQVDNDPGSGVSEPAATIAHVMVRNNYGHRTAWLVSIGSVGGPYFSYQHDQRLENNLFEEIGEPPFTQTEGPSKTGSNLFVAPGNGTRIQYLYNTVDTRNPQAQFSVYMPACASNGSSADLVTMVGNILPWSQRGWYNDCGAGNLWNAVDASMTLNRSISRNVVINNLQLSIYNKPSPIVNLGTPSDTTGLRGCPDCGFPQYFDNSGNQDVGFQNYGVRDYHLAASSPYKNWSQMGKDAGADIDVVNWSTANTVSGTPNAYLDFQVSGIAVTSSQASITYTAYDAQPCAVTVSPYPDLTRAVFTQTDAGGDLDRVITAPALLANTRYFYRVTCNGGYRRDGVFLTLR